MGQAHSEEVRSKDDITAELAEKFARKCFEPLELYSFKDNFKSLADHQQSIRYLKEDSIARFLELPDTLNVSPVIFQMLSFMGAFPFLDDAPAVLGFEQMLICVAILTDRYSKILARGAATRRKLLFKSLAVYDRRLSEKGKPEAGEAATSSGGGATHAPGFAVDAAGEEEDDDAPEDDELVLAAFSSLDVDDAFKAGDAHAATTHGAMIPTDNFRRLIMLLLLTAPLSPQESLSAYADRVHGSELEVLRNTAENVLSALVNVEESPGITFAQFRRVVPTNMPFLFYGFNALFEHFLFSRNLDLSKRKDSNSTSASPPAEQHTQTPAPPAPPAPLPLLQETGSILNSTVVSQLSFFIPGQDLFHRLRLLYSGADAGFSMGSFETKVFNWRAPTLLLVSGIRLPESDRPTGSEGVFADSLPPKRFPNGSADHRDRLVFGALIWEPWRASHRECFGGEGTLLFQLGPTHDVFPASVVNKDYAVFAKPPTAFPGLSFGCPPPRATQASRHPSVRALGPVSLVVDSSFEYGVFTHDYTSRGGAYAPSAARRFDWQERFQVQDMEVWGCGGDDEARAQRERWEWEAREAEARRRINLGTGDQEADRSLLEMAGLIGANRSGGSMM